MCLWVTIEEDGEMKLVRKRTRFMTNAPQTAVRLANMCNNDHTHIRLEGGNKTRKADVYPR